MRPNRSDRQLVEVAIAIRDLAERKDLKVYGGLVVHDADCPHPQGPCDCDPIPIYPGRVIR